MHLDIEWSVVRSPGPGRTEFTAGMLSDARYNLTDALPQGPLCLVGGGNGVDWDHRLRESHPTHLYVVVTHGRADAREHLSGLFSGHEPAQQTR